MFFPSARITPKTSSPVVFVDGKCQLTRRDKSHCRPAMGRLWRALHHRAKWLRNRHSASVISLSNPPLPHTSSHAMDILELDKVHVLIRLGQCRPGKEL